MDLEETSTVQMRPDPDSTIDFRAQTQRVPTVLIVDDDDSIQVTFGRVLALNGYAPQHARNLATAVDVAQRHKIDAVVLDMSLNGESGLDFMHWMRDHVAYEHTPIIVLTGDADLSASVAESLVRSGARLRHKPVQLAELTSTIRDSLER